MAFLQEGEPLISAFGKLEIGGTNVRVGDHTILHAVHCSFDDHFVTVDDDQHIIKGVKNNVAL